ncbi:SPP1 gp7 family putative phage head morphogenesis protein [Paraburkholderia sp. GAS333]|uniref:hypothetical protein n=1 Tax=Paraburkholderia sp. GAS333 TaxID=3156279 RepID=UPI003D2317AF
MSHSREFFDLQRASLAVDIFSSEPDLRDVAIEAISTAAIPWNCSNALIEAARAQAIRCVLSGSSPSNEIIDQLRLHVFDRKRDALHAMAKVCTFGTSAIDRARWRKLDISEFTWMSIGKPLCDFDHDALDGLVFSLGDGFSGNFPGRQYGCRCWGAPVIVF